MVLLVPAAVAVTDGGAGQRRSTRQRVAPGFLTSQAFFLESIRAGYGITNRCRPPHLICSTLSANRASRRFWLIRRGNLSIGLEKSRLNTGDFRATAQ